VFEFQTELRRADAAEPERGPRLRVYLEQDGGAVPSRLAWTAADGAHSAIAFTTEAAEFTGVFRDADGSVAHVHGRLADRRARLVLPTGAQAGAVLTFDTQEEKTGGEQDGETQAGGEGWRRSGRLCLLLDDGRGSTLRDLQWQDTRGVTGAVSFTPDRSGFLGYLGRPGREPVGYRGFAVPGRTVPSSDELMTELEEFGRQALGVVEDLLGRIGGWLGGGGSGGSGNGGGGGDTPRPA